MPRPASCSARSSLRSSGPSRRSSPSGPRWRRSTLPGLALSRSRVAINGIRSGAGRSAGAAEIERLDWDSYFVVGDAWGTATAVRVAAARPNPVLGLALGHASLSYQREGRRPAVSKEVTAAMTQLLRSDYDSFVRYGMTQFTQGAFDEETSERIVADFRRWTLPHGSGRRTSSARADRRTAGATRLAHAAGEARWLLVFTAEGYEDAVPGPPGRAQDEHQPGIVCERRVRRGP